MAGVKGGKLEASTLIEVLIAMVIILVIFSIGITLFNNVLSSGVSLKKIEVQQQLSNLSTSVADKGYIVSDEVILDSITYLFSSTPLENKRMELLEIKAVQQGRVIGKVKRLYQVKTRNEEN